MMLQRHVTVRTLLASACFTGSLSFFACTFGHCLDAKSGPNIDMHNRGSFANRDHKGQKEWDDDTGAREGSYCPQLGSHCAVQRVE